jgi:hypothetical protein
MATLFDPAQQTRFLSRIDRLTPDTQRLWGKMTVHQMVCHLTDALRVSLGEIPTRFRPSFLASPPMQWLIVSVLPIPRGKASTKPEFQTTRPSTWPEETANLKEVFARFVERGKQPGATWPIHPTFGDLSHRQWGMLTAKHMDHHLRQFGV